MSRKHLIGASERLHSSTTRVIYAGSSALVSPPDQRASARRLAPEPVTENVAEACSP